MGVVYYANYLVWMEVARVDYCRAIGFHYKDMELDDGVFLAVAESHCRYVSPARFDEEISISTTVPNVNRRFVSFDYEMTCGGRQSGDGADPPCLPEPCASSHYDCRINTPPCSEFRSFAVTGGIQVVWPPRSHRRRRIRRALCRPDRSSTPPST